MEQDLTINTPDKKKIYGRLRGTSKKTLVILVHGLCGHMDEHQFYNAARYFEKRGMSAFRFNLYDWHEGARTLNDCSFEVHARDIDLLVTRFKKQGYKKIVVVGHSFGGPSILFSTKKQFDAMVFWDPSFDETLDWFENIDTQNKKPRYELTDIFSVMIPRVLIEEIRAFRPAKIIAGFEKPALFIIAGKGELQNVRKTFDAAQEPKKFHLIKKATHSFQEDGVAEELYKVTADWIKKLPAPSTPQVK
ncbi:MAG: hypothetical protein A2848_00055 [Candidatus Magasanikbacteria bacterium RIFCSPHIGHO2_01_FULL_50_8]|uniref:AB hydrolase-1 domain-containing protein n=1 Tax=Candidatus Magasanikbacteria bacterium RIFCSPHIGHO2_01_FULL_50_8 TaxID=1798674 RepID=A0A1F6LNG7_9BACT|nr:MAG: hypothetical protein A2848_00055 [Candidatus Magasanikbacteria bacterium RIFCSPHIGHO2_01_FULL_50_8]